MNFVHMRLQMCLLSEELPTGVALERLLPKVDGFVVPLHDALLAEDFGTRRVSAWELLTKMSLTIMLQHVIVAGK